jgi:hypothetical protein
MYVIEIVDLLGVEWEVKCFNQKWFHHHQLESYSKERYGLQTLQVTVVLQLDCGKNNS